MIFLKIANSLLCDLPLSRQSATTLYMPGVILDGSEIEMLRYLGCRHRAFYILLVGKYQHGCFSEVLRAMKTIDKDTSIISQNFQLIS